MINLRDIRTNGNKEAEAQLQRTADAIYHYAEVPGEEDARNGIKSCMDIKIPKEQMMKHLERMEAHLNVCIGDNEPMERPIHYLEGHKGFHGDTCYKLYPIERTVEGIPKNALALAAISEQTGKICGLLNLTAGEGKEVWDRIRIKAEHTMREQLLHPEKMNNLEGRRDIEAPEFAEDDSSENQYG